MNWLNFMIMMIYQWINCESLIKSNLIEVFRTNGFLNSSQTMVSYIVQPAATNCRAKFVFDACISWAKNYCEQMDQDPNSYEHLRAALGDLLYDIRFDTMAFEEFITYYQTFKTLFTEILQLIGKVTDFHPKLFKCSKSKNIKI